jgi:YihY family inner membrane protein
MEINVDQSDPGAASAANHFCTLAAPVAPSGFVSNALCQLRARAWPTLKYLTQTDVHTYAFSVAANAILAFFPFILLLMTLARNVFHSPRMYDVITQLVRACVPTGQEFIVRNFSTLVEQHHGVKIVSLAMLLVSSTGVFLPLEVALNQVWGFRKNRSYIGNQLISLGLSFGCGMLAVVSIWFTASNQAFMGMMFLGHTDNRVFALISRVVIEAVVTLACIGVYFLIYWLLPNGKVKARWVLPVAVLAGLLQEAAKFIYVAVLPLLDFREAYGPFYVSISLMFWAFISGLLLLGGAQLSAAGRIPAVEDPQRDPL